MPSVTMKQTEVTVKNRLTQQVIDFQIVSKLNIIESDRLQHLTAEEGSPHASAVVKQWINETIASIVGQGDETQTELYHHHLNKRTLSDECHRSDLLGTLTQNASPFLFPCAIEYSLICAAIMFEIWKHTGESEHHSKPRSINDSPAGMRTPRTPGMIHPYRRSPHHYSVDCTNANKGLFFGIFVLVLSILAMILFFVLINRDDYKSTAITIIHLSELILYILTLVAVLIGIIQVRDFPKIHFIK